MTTSNDLISTATLCAVERFVGLGEKVLGLATVKPGRCHADADRDRMRLFAEIDSLCRVTDSCCNETGLRHVGLRKNDDKFVAAVTSDERGL